MRATDLRSKYQTRPIIYVDMDGVLADFFGEVARQHEVDYWKEIHRKEIGVDQVAQEPGFFATLPIMPHSPQLMMGILSLTDQYSILSSPLLSDVDQSSEEKADWLRRHLGKHQPQAVIFDHEKYKYAKQANGTPNILIDDYPTNIALWNLNGGVGILHNDAEYKETVKELAHALAGLKKGEKPGMEVMTSDEPVHIKPGKLFTNQQVLKYVSGIHHEYHMPKPILKHKTWVLANYPIENIKNPEFFHQDDPYRRVIDLDWDHISKIQRKDLKKKPIVVDDTGWVLDGNHRATAARAAGLETIPALMPYLGKQ